MNFKMEVTSCQVKNFFRRIVKQKPRPFVLTLDFEILQFPNVDKWTHNEKLLRIHVYTKTTTRHNNNNKKMISFQNPIKSFLFRHAYYASHMSYFHAMIHFV